MSADSGNRQEPVLSLQMLAILLALADRGRHGYGLIQEVEGATHGLIRLLPGSLYSSLKRLLRDGLITELDSPAEGGDARRRYYGLTELGRSAAAAEVERMARLVALAGEKGLASATSGGSP